MREGQHLGNRSRARDRHQQTIDTERNARALGQTVFERFDQVVIGLINGLAA